MPDGVFITCCRCKQPMWLPRPLHDTAMAMREKLLFYCAYGHVQCYITGEPEETKLRRERDRLAQQIAQKDDELKAQRAETAFAEAREAAQKANVTKLKKRASAGVCPCCNRTFLALRAHMKNKHPGFSEASK